jgi:hypothetical protein
MDGLSPINISSFFCFLLSYLSQRNYMFVLCSFFFSILVFMFFYGLFLSLVFLQKFFMFSIQSFNYNLLYFIFFQSDFYSFKTTIRPLHKRLLLFTFKG